MGTAGEAGYPERSRQAILMDPILYVVNSILLVPSIIKDPPTESREYEGRVLAPTYTAAVPFDAANTGSTYEGRDAREEVLRERQAQRPRAATTRRRTSGTSRQARASS